MMRKQLDVRRLPGPVCPCRDSTFVRIAAALAAQDLVAGIWEMNFEGMPELKLVFGYPVALGLIGRARRGTPEE